MWRWSAVIARPASRCRLARLPGWPGATRRSQPPHARPPQGSREVAQTTPADVRGTTRHHHSRQTHLMHHGVSAGMLGDGARGYHSRWAISVYGRDPTVPDQEGDLYDGYEASLEEFATHGFQFSDSMTDDEEEEEEEEEQDEERDEEEERSGSKPSDEDGEDGDDPLAGWAGAEDDVVSAVAAAREGAVEMWDASSVTTEDARDVVLAPGLYLVGTPIGNLEDITLRALRVLRDADAVLAEDTRHTRRLLTRYGISQRLVSYHAHNEAVRRAPTMERLRAGAALALVSDAGTPAVADPGADLAAACAAEGVPVIPIPGASAPAAALIASGLPTDAFTFVGFLPPKSGARRRRLEALVNAPGSLVAFVPPHKLVATVEDAAAVLGAGRRCCVCREMTKVHEEFWRGTLAAAAAEFKERSPRGEITLVVEGVDATGGEAGFGGGGRGRMTGEDLEAAIAAMLDEGVSPSEASKRAAGELGARKKEAYAIALRLSGKR